MKQIIQDLYNGKISLADLPEPKCIKNHLLIKTNFSLISAGTEKMLIDFGKANLLSKAQQHPDKVSQVLDKIKSDGLISTISAVNRKLEEPIPLGYCNVGVVIGTGDGVKGFSVGDRVVSNGPHAELFNVGQNLTVKIPNSVSDEEAVFSVLGAVGMQSVRLINPLIGETICVVGLGLLGHLIVKILVANGCNVIVIEKNQDRLSQIENKYVTKICIKKDVNVNSIIENVTNGYGVDSVIIATATNSNEPLKNSIDIVKQNGKIVIVGTVGMNVSRDSLFRKQVTLQVSRSYGPGRYDINYEKKNIDYPFELVRWTAQRNISAFVDLLRTKKICLKDLPHKIFNFEDCVKAYSYLDKKTKYLGLLLKYQYDDIHKTKSYEKNLISRKEMKINYTTNELTKIKIGFIGSGGHSRSTLLPVLSKFDVNLDTLVSRNLVTGSQLSKKYSFKTFSANINDIWDNKAVNTVFIATNHDSHAELINKALEHNKNIYVEKPLCMNKNELDEISINYKKSKSKLMVGYNRRYAPFYKIAKELILNNKNNIVINILINAGKVPSDHWTNDIDIGGGRIIGELCHFLDLIVYLTGSLIISIQSQKIVETNNQSVFVNLKTSDGSLASIQYITTGHRSFPKERVEVFMSNKIIQINNFRNIKFFGWGKKLPKFSFSQNKGTYNIFDEFIKNIKSLNYVEPIPFEDIKNVSLSSFKINETIK